MKPSSVPLTVEDAKRELARRAKAELERRRQTPEFVAGVVAALRAELFPQQIQVIDSPARRIALCCSRRAGKSELAARMIAIALLQAKHNTYVLFAARTMVRARQIIWNLLLKISDDYGLGWRFSEHTGVVTTQAGAVFIILGCDDATAIEKVRGSKYALAVCDEAATYETLLERLIVDCVEPGTIDLRPRGRILVCGTPGYAQAGYWYDLATGNRPGWQHYFWTLKDNPHIPDVEESLASIREANGWDEMDPTYRREYLGEWVADSTTLVYQATRERNTCRLADLPQPPAGKTWQQWVREEWLTTVGADIGVSDAFACVTLGSPPNSHDVYALESFSQVGLRAEEQAEIIQAFRERWAPTQTVIDIGGAGKMVMQEFNLRHGHKMGGPASPAIKTGKVEAIALMNSDLRVGRVKCVEAADALMKEWAKLVWTDEERTKVGKHQADHLSDAALYAWRSHRGFLAKLNPPKPTQEELELAAQARRLEAARREARR